MGKKKLKRRVRKLEEELRLMARQAHYAEVVCWWVGQYLDPKSRFVLDNRRTGMALAYKRWKQEVPQPPYRGVFWSDFRAEFCNCPRAEWQDAAGYWHLLKIPGDSAEETE